MPLCVKGGAMVSKFKKNDVVYFTDKSETPSLQYPVKSSSFKVTGSVLNVDNVIVRVLWSTGVAYNYYESSLSHKHGVIMFLRYLYDGIKEDLTNIKSKISYYRLYRSFKKGNMVCLKQSTVKISVCDVGVIIGKCYPNLVIRWEIDSLGYTCHFGAVAIEHYAGLDPNRSFELYKRNSIS